MPAEVPDTVPGARRMGSGVAEPEHYRLPERLDPYWAGAWTASPGGSAVAWGGRHWERRLAAAADPEARAALVAAERQAVAAALSARRRRGALFLLAALQSWGALRFAQAAVLTGEPAVRGRRGPVPALEEAGLVQIGRVVTVGRGVPGLRLLRLDGCGPFERLDEMISFREWMAATGGLPWGRALPADRHSVLSAELSLRAAESSPLAAILGERQCNLAEFFGAPAGKTRSDALWVRSDGLCIHVELVASADRRAQAKLVHRIEMVRADPTRSNVVLFVGAASPSERRRERIHKDLRDAMVRATAHSPDAADTDVAQRVAWIRWEDWFPSPGVMTAWPRTLRVHSPSGPPGARWETLDLADPFAVPAGHPLPGRLGGYQRLAALPPWQRRASEDDFVEELIAAAGMESPYLRLEGRPFGRTDGKRAVVDLPAGPAAVR